MSGTLEIAFDMIESTLLSNSDGTLKIVGIYEAPLLTKSDHTLTPLTHAIVETIRASHF